MPNPWEEYSAVDTATAEEKGPWNDFVETEKTGAILPPGWKPRPTAESMLMDPVTGLKRESGMESGTELTTALGAAALSAPSRIASAYRSLTGTAEDSGVREYTIPKEPQPIGPPAIVQPSSPQMKTTLGGVPQPVETYVQPPEERRQQFFTGLQTPAVALPKFDIKPDESALNTAWKEAANLAISIPEFFETPLGIMTAGLGAEGKTAAVIVRRLFLADMLKNVFQEYPEMVSNWSRMTPSEKTKALIDISGSAVMAGLLASPEVRARVSTPPARVGMPAPELTGTEALPRPGPEVPEQIQIGPLRLPANRLPIPGGLVVRPSGLPPTLPPPTTQETGAPDMGDILSGSQAMQRPTVTETTPKVPESEMPKTPTATGTRPAIRLVGGEVVVGDAGMTHPDIIARDKIPADKIDQRGGVDENGNFLDREQWAKVLEAQGITPQSEVERAHSTDLPEAKPEPTPEEKPVEAKPEIARMSGGSNLKNKFGDPSNTIYHATPEDWAKWQDIQRRRSAISKEYVKDVPKNEAAFMSVVKETEDMKNKYGGMPPAPPRVEAEAPAKPAETTAPAEVEQGVEGAEVAAPARPDFAQRAIPVLEQRIGDLHGLLINSEGFAGSEFYDGSFPIPRQGGIIAARHTQKYQSDPIYASKVDAAINDITDTMVRANRQRMALMDKPNPGAFGVDYSVGKARATYGVNVVRAWHNEAKNVYDTHLLGNISIREGFQNSLDAVMAAIQNGEIRRGTIKINTQSYDNKGFKIDDNGIGMSDADIGDKFLSLHSSGKAVQGRFGGFGIAKAVILGPADSGTWTLHTRDNKFSHELASANAQVETAPRRQGTEIEVITQEEILNEQAKQYVETSDLPKSISVEYDGVPAKNPFRRLKSEKQAYELNPETSYEMAYYPHAPGGYDGKFIIRLVDPKTGSKLTQAIRDAGTSDFHGAVMVDITTSTVPGTEGYPLVDSRMYMKWGAEQPVRKLVEKHTIDPLSALKAGQKFRFEFADNRSEWKGTINKLRNQLDPGYLKLTQVINDVWNETGHFFGAAPDKPFTPITELIIKIDRGYKGYTGGTVFQAKHLAAYEAVSRLMSHHAGANVTDFYGVLSKGGTTNAEHAAGGEMGLGFLNIDKTSLKSPYAYACYLRDLVAHELTHDFYGPHNEEFTSKLGEVQRKTGHLLPYVLRIAEATLGKEIPKEVVERRVEVPVEVRIEVPVEKTTFVDRYLSPRQQQFIYDNIDESPHGKSKDDLYQPARPAMAGQLQLAPGRTGERPAGFGGPPEVPPVGGRPQQPGPPSPAGLEPPSVGTGAVVPTPKIEAPGLAKSTVDDWITKLESLKSKGGEPGLASFPDPEVFKGIGSALRNTAIDVAIGVLKAGKSIGEALDAAMAHIRERVKEFDEPKLRAAFEAYLNPPETTGIAHRVSEARGMAPERGEGVAAADSVEHGRVLLEKGLDPQAVLDVFSRTKSVRADDMAVVRAHLERLSKATNDAADTYGIDSPEYKAAWEAEKDWRAAVKPMQTEWHRIGMAQQGETDIDTGSFTGLQRAHQEKTGTDFTPGQSKRAQRIAKANKDAQNATGGAQQKLNRHLVNKSKSMTESEQAALDAAHKTVRDAAARNAEAENKARVAEEVRKQAVDKVQADAEAAAAKVQTEVAKREAINRVKAENKARVAAATKAKSTADAQLKATQKALDTANKTVRDAAAKAAEKERKLQGDPILRVWTKAKEYLDKGIDNFDDIRKKLATDLGMSIEQVTRLLQQDQRAKLLADDLWRKQQKERQLKSQAKRWVQNLSTPGYLKALQSIPKIMFGLKVGFHGTVALGTHAPTVAFRPRFWAAYVRDFGKMYKMVGSKTYYENQVQDLMRRDNYITARRAGLVNDPFVYEDFNSPDTAKYFGGLTGMGNRGYTVLKILRQDMFDQHWNQLPKSMQIPEIAEAIADAVNHATGVVQGRAPRGTNVALFAPRLEASRVMWLLGDPARAVGTLLNWKNASLGEKYFAMNQLKEKAWVVGTLGSLLALNQGVLYAIGSDQKINVTDPFKPDFLKFKVAGMNVSYGNPMITMARLPLRLFVGVENEGKLNKIVYEDENVATVLFEYVRSQMSPFAGTVTDLGIGRDYMRRPLPRAGFGLLPGKRNIPKRLRAEGIKPYTWPEYFIQQLAMIPVQEALKEVWGKDLVMDAEARERSLKALATIIVMGGTGARVSADWSVQNKSTPPEEQGPWNDFK